MTSSNQSQNSGCLNILMAIMASLIVPLVLQTTEPFWWGEVKGAVASHFALKETSPAPEEPSLPRVISQNPGQSTSKCSPPNNTTDKCFVVSFSGAENRGIYSDTTGQAGSKVGAIWRGDEVLLLNDKVVTPSSGSWYRVRVIKSGKQAVGIEGWIRSSYIE